MTREHVRRLTERRFCDTDDSQVCRNQQVKVKAFKSAGLCIVTIQPRTFHPQHGVPIPRPRVARARTWAQAARQLGGKP